MELGQARGFYESVHVRVRCEGERDREREREHETWALLDSGRFCEILLETTRLLIPDGLFAWPCAAQISNGVYAAEIVRDLLLLDFATRGHGPTG